MKSFTKKQKIITSIVSLVLLLGMSVTYYFVSDYHQEKVLEEKLMDSKKLVEDLETLEGDFQEQGDHVQELEKKVKVQKAELLKHKEFLQENKEKK